MLRATRISLKFITARKRRHIAELLVQYRAAVNYYIRRFWAGEAPAWDALRGHTRLSCRYISQAHRQAFAIVRIARKRKAGKMPVFRGRPVLDAKFVSVEDGLGSFDLVVRLSGLSKGNRLVLPCRRTRHYNFWASKPGAKVIQGCALDSRSLILWIEVPDQESKCGRAIGVDIGLHKMLVDSDGNTYGTEFRAIVQKVARRKPGSKGKARAIRHRDNYIGYVLNRVPWHALGTIVIEQLKNLKHGKKRNRSKAFRKALSPWTYRQVTTRLRQKAQEHRVLVVAVDPRNTSRLCPSCGTTSKENRKGEAFRCVSCGHTADADCVGAVNVLHRYLSDSARSLESLVPTKAM